MDDFWRSDEIAVRTPPTYSRTPVHLRLSMNRREMSPYDAEYDDPEYADPQEAEYDDPEYVEPPEDARQFLSRSNSRQDKSSFALEERQDGVRRFLSRSSSRNEERQDDVRRYLSRSSSRNEERQDSVRRFLSRSSSRMTKSMPEPEYEYLEDEPRKTFTRFPSKRDRPVFVFDHQEDGTRRRLSRSSSRKVMPEFEPEVEHPGDLLEYDADVIENGMEDSELSERRKALFEPLGPSYRGPRDCSPDSSVPPPDFDVSTYPKGWVVGKKRKLVNVDVVESMRRIAVHEMNRKDREIGGLNEQLGEDSKTMEHLQIQLQQERTKRMQIERENNMLQSQINMLMTMLNEAPEVDNDEEM